MLGKKDSAVLAWKAGKYHYMLGKRLVIFLLPEPYKRDHVLTQTIELGE